MTSTGGGHATPAGAQLYDTVAAPWCHPALFGGGVTFAVRGAHLYGWLSNLSAQSTNCFWRSGTRSAPHNLLLDPACARASATLAGPARPVFLHDGGGDVPGESDARFTVRMDGLDVTWVWDAAAQRYQRRQRSGWHVDADGDQVGAENVVVLFVDYRPSPADAKSPEAVIAIAGIAWGFRVCVFTRNSPPRGVPLAS